MISFFSRASDEQQLQGSPAYLESIQAMFAQEERGGLIEVDLSPDERRVYLYYDGQVVAAYCMSRQRVVALDPEPSWPDEAQDLGIRYLKIPDQAVRAAWQALEWYPPRRGAHLDAADLGAYMDALRVESVRGLLYVVLPDMDGFVLLWDGQPVTMETVLASPRGFLESMPNLRGLSTPVAGICDVWLNEFQPNSRVTELVELRVSFCAWVNAWLTGYQQLVGHNLLIGLNNYTNTWLRQHPHNLRLVGVALVDHHLFLYPDQAVQAYRNLATSLTEQIAQVIGHQLAARSASDAFRRLKSLQQKVLEQHDLAPGRPV